MARTIGYVLREFRERYLRMEREEFCTRMGIPEERLLELEEDREIMMGEELYAVCNTFNVSADYICALVDRPHPVFQKNGDTPSWSEADS